MWRTFSKNNTLFSFDQRTRVKDNLVRQLWPWEESRETSDVLFLRHPLAWWHQLAYDCWLRHIHHARHLFQNLKNSRTHFLDQWFSNLFVKSCAAKTTVLQSFSGAPCSKWGWGTQGPPSCDSPQTPPQTSRHSLWYLQRNSGLLGACLTPLLVFSMSSIKS